MRIGILNTSTSYTTAEIAAAVPAMNSFLVEFARYWPEAQGAAITDVQPSGDPVEVDNMLVTVQENTPPNGIGDLAYHTPGGNGACFVFAGAIKACGADLIVDIMHEIGEALVNPTCRRMAPDGYRLVEPMDPVSYSFVSWSRGGVGNDEVLMPNFTTPSYFGLVTAHLLPLDYNRQLTSDQDILRGGIQMRLSPDKSRWINQLGLVEEDDPMHVTAGMTARQMKSIGRLAYARCLPRS